MHQQQKIRKRNSRNNSIATASKRIKYLGINIPKETKDLYSENYKMLMKKIKKDTNRWKDISCSQIGKINIVKMITIHKAIYGFSTIPIKLPMEFFADLKQKVLKHVCKHKKVQIAKGISRRKNIAEIKVYYKVPEIKPVWYWHTDRLID